jgi:hypothetical protein
MYSRSLFNVMAFHQSGWGLTRWGVCVVIPSFPDMSGIHLNTSGIGAYPDNMGHPGEFRSLLHVFFSGFILQGDMFLELQTCCADQLLILPKKTIHFNDLN